MKKLFAILLALMMVLSLAACGGGSDDKTPSSEDKTPSSTQQQEQNTPEADEGEDEPDNSGEEQENAKTFEFPTADYIKDCMVWSGAGKVVLVTEANYTDEQNKDQTYPVISVSIDAATMDELSAYIDNLKANGFVFQDYEGLGEELVFRSSGSCGWCGILEGESYINITLYEQAREARELIDGETIVCDYQLKITMSSKTNGTWYL